MNDQTADQSPPASAASPLSPDPSAYIQPPLSIAALDDDPDFRQYLRHLLESEGHQVRLASTSDELFTLCAESLPDIVLLDMKMGRESGEVVLEELRRRWSKLCIIIVTGYPTLENMRQTFKRDVFDYLSKPFSIADLKRTIAQASLAFGLGLRPQDRLRLELGHAIRMARTNRAWTLKDLSEASGVSVSQLSSIERGSHLPSLDSLLEIAAALDQKASSWLVHAGF